MYYQDLFQTLKKLQTPFEHYTHAPFFSCEESSIFHKEKKFHGVRVKNIFLRNKNGKKHFLLMLPHEKNFDRDAFRSISGHKCSFASDERLWKYLGVKPGSVSALALINDTDQEVEVFIDKDLMNSKYLHIHPLKNDESIQITPQDLEKLLIYWNYELQVI